MKQVLKVFIFIVFGLISQPILSKTRDEQRYDNIVYKLMDDDQVSKEDLLFLQNILSKKINFLQAIINEFKKNYPNMYYEQYKSSPAYESGSEEAKILQELQQRVDNLPKALKEKSAEDIDRDMDKENDWRFFASPYTQKKEEYEGYLKKVSALLQQKDGPVQTERVDVKLPESEEIEYSFKYSADDEKRIEDLLAAIDEPGAVSYEDLLFLKNIIPHKLTFIEAIRNELDKGIDKIDPGLITAAKVIPSPQDLEKFEQLKRGLAQALKNKNARAISLLMGEYEEEKGNYNEFLDTLEDKIKAEQKKMGELEKTRATEQAAQQAAQAKQLAEEAAAKKRVKDAELAAQQAAEQAAADRTQKLAEEEAQRKKLEEDKKRAAQEQKEKEKEAYAVNLKKYIQESRKTLINNLQKLLKALDEDEESIKKGSIGKPTKTFELPDKVKKYLEDIVEGLKFPIYGVLYNQAILLRNRQGLNKIKELRITVQKILNSLK